MNKHKLLSIVLSLALVFGMTSAFGVSAYAESAPDGAYVPKAPATVTVAGQKLNSNQYIYAGSQEVKTGIPNPFKGYAYYKGGKLILHNYVLKDFNDNAAIAALDNYPPGVNALNIVLEGQSTIKMRSQHSAIDAGYLDLVISANTKGASLSLESQNGTYPAPQSEEQKPAEEITQGGIAQADSGYTETPEQKQVSVDCISAGSFELLSGTVNISAGNKYNDKNLYDDEDFSLYMSYFDTGISALSGDAVISGGKLNISKAAVGISAEMASIRINGGEVNIGDTKQNNSITRLGLYTKNLVVNGGSLSIKNVGNKETQKYFLGQPTEEQKLTEEQQERLALKQDRTHHLPDETDQQLVSAQIITDNKNCDGALVYESVIIKDGRLSVENIGDYGIEIKYGDFILYGGSAEIKSVGADGINLRYGDADIKGGSLSISNTGKDGMDISTDKIGSENGKLNMSGGSILMSDIGSRGIYVNADADISNAKIDINNTIMDGFCSSNCSIYNSSVSITESGWDGISCTDKLLDINNSTVTLKDIDENGICIYGGKAAITDSAVNIAAGSDGIYANSGVEVENSDVEVQSLSNFKDCHAFYPTVVVSGSPVVYAGSTKATAKKVTNLNKLDGYQYVHIYNDTYTEPVKSYGILSNLLQNILKLNFKFNFFRFSSWDNLFKSLFNL